MIPLDYTEKFLPGLGVQHYTGAEGAGVNLIDCTINANTVQTSAQLVSAPPANGAGSISYGPVVHSLGRTPAFAQAELLGTVNPSSEAYLVNLAIVTADNSAVYIRARGHSVGVAAIPIRVIVWP